jgi:hypothetical protein
MAQNPPNSASKFNGRTDSDASAKPQRGTRPHGSREVAFSENVRDRMVLRTGRVLRRDDSAANNEAPAPAATQRAPTGSSDRLMVPEPRSVSRADSERSRSPRTPIIASPRTPIAASPRTLVGVSPRSDAADTVEVAVLARDSGSPRIPSPASSEQVNEPDLDVREAVATVAQRNELALRIENIVFAAPPAFPPPPTRPTPRPPPRVIITGQTAQTQFFVDVEAIRQARLRGLTREQRAQLLGIENVEPIDEDDNGNEEEWEERPWVEGDEWDEMRDRSFVYDM